MASEPLFAAGKIVAAAALTGHFASVRVNRLKHASAEIAGHPDISRTLLCSRLSRAQEGARFAFVLTAISLCGP